MSKDLDFYLRTFQQGTEEVASCARAIDKAQTRLKEYRRKIGEVQEEVENLFEQDREAMEKRKHGLTNWWMLHMKLVPGVTKIYQGTTVYTFDRVSADARPPHLDPQFRPEIYATRGGVTRHLGESWTLDEPHNAYTPEVMRAVEEHRKLYDELQSLTSKYGAARANAIDLKRRWWMDRYNLVPGITMIKDEHGVEYLFSSVPSNCPDPNPEPFFKPPIVVGFPDGSIAGTLEKWDIVR